MALRHHDVTVIGGGIAGGSLATVLARGGLDVLILERDSEYRDRVLGEGMFPWGVAEARRSGVEDALRKNPDGSVTITHWLGYGSAAESREVAPTPSSFRDAVEGVEGVLDVRHPAACEALSGAAAAAGATVERRTSVESATFGKRPTVTWSVGRERKTATSRLVVGADGKGSAVRRHASMILREEPPRSVVAGMLVGGLEGAPQSMGYSVHEVDRQLIAFPQAHARARLYVCFAVTERTRFAGKEGPSRFLAAWDSAALPFRSVITGGRQEGPCATFPLASASVDRPLGDGVVLIGDAAGWVDPLIGQGLSMAMRDARMVAEVLLGEADWTSGAFAPYVSERRDRLAKLALLARINQRLDVDFSPDFVDRRHAAGEILREHDLFGPLMAAQMKGPENASPDVLGRAARRELAEILGVAV